MCFPFTAEGEAVTRHEEEEAEDQEEADIQITAAVMDLTGDSDIEEVEPHDEDYSSFELDDSDAVLGKYLTPILPSLCRHSYSEFMHFLPFLATTGQNPF